MENLEFWDKYKAVPKTALKDFDTGRFKGTDINTMWRMKVLTETYGKCGFGWYFKILRMWTETTPEKEVFAFAEIELYIKENGEWSMPISGNGGNKLLRNTKSGTSSSDEAYKMAVTDAFGVACRNLGIGADVYWENDKTKYTEEQSVKTTKVVPVNKKITEEQYKEMVSLGVNFENVKLKFKIDFIEDLTYNDAENVINIKKKSLEK